MWALVMQGICDSKRRFTMVAVNGIGSTNDSIAWDMSDTGQSFIKKGGSTLVMAAFA